jgi:hypothetical protein
MPDGNNNDYEQAYSNTVESVISTLWTVETPDATRTFITQASRYIRFQAENTPEFYMAEFFNMFKDAVVGRATAEIAASERDVSDAKAGAHSASVELQARLTTARAAHDREAEHSLWREREMRQAEYQAKVDASKRRIASVSLRLDACKELASALQVRLT